MFSGKQNGTAISIDIDSEKSLNEQLEETFKSNFSKTYSGSYSTIQSIALELIDKITESNSPNNHLPPFKLLIEILSDGNMYMRFIYIGTEENYKRICQSLNSSSESKNISFLSSLTENIWINRKADDILINIVLNKTPDFKLHISNDGWINLHIRGDLDNSKSIKLQKILNSLYIKQYSRFCLDFDSVNEMNFIGINILIVLFKVLNKATADFELKIVNASEPISNFLRSTKLDKFYKISEKVDCLVAAI